jgi:hypothetical protein
MSGQALPFAHSPQFSLLTIGSLTRIIGVSGLIQCNLADADRILPD